MLYIVLALLLLISDSSAARLKPQFEEPTHEATKASISELKDEGEGDEVPSEYRFNGTWEGLSFEDRWESFREAVPLSDLQDHYDKERDTGPACHPLLEGPSDSENLAILIHGYTSCPATYYPLAKLLVTKGFRVLRPTLPGHGRKWENKNTSVCTLKGTESDSRDAHENEIDSESLNDTSIANKGDMNVCENQTQRTDDLSRLPEEPGPYLHFAEALGQLVEQFKKEHPNGKVVVMGHSLGGIIAAKFALERPMVVDRLLLANPMFGLPTNLVTPLLRMSANARVGWSMLGNKDCDSLRGRNSGGYCQFKLAHVVAMSNLAYIVLCEQWGLEEACRFYSTQAASMVTAGVLGGHAFVGLGLAVGSVLGPPGAAVGGVIGLATGLWAGKRAGASLGKSFGKWWRTRDSEMAKVIRRGFARLPQIQTVTTKGDLAIDNKRVERLMDEIVKQRGELRTVGTNSSYCYWPTALTHSYNNMRDQPAQDPWFHPYVETAYTGFLANGNFVDIVEIQRPPHNSKHIDTFGMCLLGPTQVIGDALTILPAVQHGMSYTLASQSSPPVSSEILLAVDVRKQSESLGMFRRRHVEMLSLLVFGATLLVTRAHKDDTVRDVFLLVGRSARSSSPNCIKATLQKLDNTGKPSLLDQVRSLYSVEANVQGKFKIEFCESTALADLICERQGCD